MKIKQKENKWHHTILSLGKKGLDNIRCFVFRSIISAVNVCLQTGIINLKGRGVIRLENVIIKVIPFSSSTSLFCFSISLFFIFFFSIQEKI